MTEKKFEIDSPEGKLVVLLPGLGAVSTTFIAGVQAIRKGLAKPIGSLTQMGTIRLGKRTEYRIPTIKEFVPLVGLEDLSFAAWDIFEDDAYQAAKKAGVLERTLLDPIQGELEAIQPHKAVFDQNYVKRLHGTHVKKGENKMDLAEQLMEDIEERQKGVRRRARRHDLVRLHRDLSRCRTRCTRISVPSNEDSRKTTRHRPEHGLRLRSHPSGVPYANGAPNLTVDVPALTQLAHDKGVPIGGKDFKTGQTMMKTIIAPGLKARMLGLSGWFSSNILGNRDGEVLDDPGSFKTKEESKLSVFEYILQPQLYPDLYGDFYHKVRINYYPPRGDNKEGWDNIDIFGWLGYPMQIKVDFLCRDSILAAPLVLDLALFFDLAQRAKFKGIQEWLSFYFKSPMSPAGVLPGARSVHSAHQAQEHTPVSHG